MQKLNYDRTNSITNKNSVVLDSTGESFNKKTFLGKIMSIIRQEVDAVLSLKDIKNGLYYSKEKGLVKLEGDNILGNEFMYIRQKDEEIEKMYKRCLQVLDPGFSLKLAKRNDGVLYM